MVKDAVKYNADTMRMERFTNFFEICVGSKPPVKRIIIGRIVSMLGFAALRRCFAAARRRIQADKYDKKRIR